MRSTVLIAAFILASGAALASDRTLNLVLPGAGGEGPRNVEIVLDPNVPLEISPDGNVYATGSALNPEICEGSGPECPDCSCDAQVEIGSFSVNNEASVTVSPNARLDFRWASRGAWACEGSGLLPGTAWNDTVKDPSGIQTVSNAGLEPGETYTPTLICSNGSAPNARDERSVTVNVIAPAPVPEGCEGRIPEHLTRATRCIHSGTGFGADCTNYYEIFASEGVFPGPDGSARNFELQRGQYAALQFIVPDNLSRRGSWSLTEAQFSGSTASGKITTLSKCPGDFSKQAIDAESQGRCYVRSEGSSMVLWEPESGSDAFRCNLEAGETYYLNIVFTDSPSGTPPNEINWRCPGNLNACGHRMSVITSN